MINKHIKYFLLFSYILMVSLFVGCTQIKRDNLSLWDNEAPAKKAIISYVKDVTNKKSKNFIPVEDRIAVFDLDGTLILETDPSYFDWALFEHRVLDDPNYKPTKEQIVSAKTSRERGIFPALNNNREQMVSEVYKGMTLEEFYDFIRKFMQEDQPGFVNMKRGDIFYKPMIEVVEYLIKNKFTVYICSGSDRLMVRPLIENNLPYIQPKQIIGSDSMIVSNKQGKIDGLSHIFEKDEELILGGKNLIKNLQMNKVSVIAQEIGKRPVLAFGNTLSDASMLNYTIYGNKYKALAFMISCDDLEREYGNTEKAEKMRTASVKYGWISISMRDDWKTIYGDNIKRR